MNEMIPTLKQITSFIHRHRNKIMLSAAIIAAVGAVGTVGYITYNSIHSTERNSTDDRRRHHVITNTSNNKRNNHRTRLLLQIRRQFDIACEQFLPTLRMKIISEVDINGTVRRIKELRSKATSSTSYDLSKTEENENLEEELWDEIKDASFAMMIVCCYMIAAVCTLLKVQLHVLARYLSIEQMQKHSNNSLNDDEIQLHDSEMFRLLIEGTYKQLFSTGLNFFTKLIKKQIKIDLNKWKVKNKTAVEYDDLVQELSILRSNIEADFDNIIRSVFIPPEGMNIIDSNNTTTTTTNTTTLPTSIQRLLYQIWDLIESPNFQAVYTESIDNCFRIIFGHLRYSIFIKESEISSINNHEKLEKPPLASLLPQIKSIALNLLPTTNQTMTSEIKEIASGPFLEAFCIAIFDAP